MFAKKKDLKFAGSSMVLRRNSLSDLLIISVIILVTIYALLNIYPFEIQPNYTVTYSIKGGWIDYLILFMSLYVFIVLLLTSKRIKTDVNFRIFIVSYIILSVISIFQTIFLSFSKPDEYTLKRIISLLLLWYMPLIAFVEGNSAKSIDARCFLRLLRIIIWILFIYLIYVRYWKLPFILRTRSYVSAAQIFVMYCIIETYFYFKDLKLNLVSVITFALGLVLLFLSGYRSFLLIVLSFPIFYLLFEHSYKKLIIYSSIILVVTLLFAFLPISYNLLAIERIHITIHYIFLGHWNNVSVGDRISFWKESLVLFRQNPLFGGGWSTFFFDSDIYVDQTKIIAPHSLWLRVLLDMGSVGLVLFMIMLVNLFKAIWHNKFLVSLFLSYLLSVFWGEGILLYSYQIGKMPILVFFWLIVGTFLKENFPTGDKRNERRAVI